MMALQSVVIFLFFTSAVLAYAGEYIPKSYYVIDHTGHISDVVYFRSKRDIESFPLLRMRRSGAGSSSSAQSSAKASASSSSSSGGNTEGGGGTGGGGAPFFPGGGDYNPGITDFDFGFDPSQFFNFPGAAGGGGGGAGSFSHSFASSSSSSSGGAPGQGGFGGVGGHQPGYNGPVLFSRFGEDTGTGVKISSSAQGPRGAFSSSSSSIDSDGKIKYSTKSGKY